jgi:hypothetical protein
MPGIAGIITSVIGGIQQRNAVQDAARALQQGAQGAGDTFGAGVTDNLGIIGEGYAQAAGGVQGAAEQAGNYGSEAARQAAAQAAAAAAAAGAGVTGAAGQANALLDPYLQAGRDSLGRFGDIQARLDQLSQAPSMSAADLEQDPGYQFRLKEAQKAIERSAASRGTLQGGATMKALTRYSQDAASQEFQNMFARNLATKNQQLQTMSTQLSTLGDLSRLGYSAAGTAGNNLQQAATYAGNAGTRAAEYGGNAVMTGDMYAGDKLFAGATYAGNAGMRSADMRFGALTDVARYKADMELQKANAKAGGNIGSANAWNSMLSGIGKSVDGAMAGGGGTFGGMFGGAGSGMPSGMVYRPSGQYGPGYYRG